MLRDTGVHRDVGLVFPIGLLQCFEIGKLHPLAVGHEDLLEIPPLGNEAVRLRADRETGDLDEVLVSAGRTRRRGRRPPEEKHQQS